MNNSDEYIRFERAESYDRISVDIQCIDNSKQLRSLAKFLITIKASFSLSVFLYVNNVNIHHYNRYEIVDFILTKIVTADSIDIKSYIKSNPKVPQNILYCNNYNYGNHSIYAIELEDIHHTIKKFYFNAQAVSPINAGHIQ